MKKYEYNINDLLNIYSKRGGIISHPSFLVTDVTGFIRDAGIKSNIIHVMDPTESDKEEIAELAKNNIIVTTAYISKDEFPEEEWDVEPKEGKKLIPRIEVLMRESKKLEALGFEDVNDYVQYFYSVAFIYKNELSQPIIDKMHAANKKEDVDKIMVKNYKFKISTIHGKIKDKFIIHNKNNKGLCAIDNHPASNTGLPIVFNSEEEAQHYLDTLDGDLSDAVIESTDISFFHHGAALYEESEDGVAIFGFDD